jgi:hypothetical protein
MRVKRRLAFLSFLLAICLLASAAQAERIRLKLALLPDLKHRYYHELLNIALKVAGHNPFIERVGGLTQEQIAQYLTKDRLTLHWFLQTKERDTKYVPVRVGITNGLIGQRILFIPKGQQPIYDNVNTLDDFKKLEKSAALGRMWFDVDVWKHNNLKYVTQAGDWRDIYRKLADQVTGFDYFPRGCNEVIDEALLHPEIDIERRMMLIYDRDFYFYLSEANAKYQPILESALSSVKKSGIMDDLIRKQWAGALNIMGYDNRVRIQLATPAK